MRLIGFILVIFIPVLLTGQITVDKETAKKLENSEEYVTSEFNEEEIAEYIKEKKLKVKMELGTFFGTSFGSGNYFGTYVSPQISYRLSPRFTLNTGARITNTFGNPFYESGFYSPYGYPATNFTRSFVYVEGAYQVNNRLTISGAAYKEINLINTPSPSIDAYNFDSKGFIMGVDYRIGENIFIHGQIEVSDGPGYYRANPFSSPASGFGSSPFHPPQPRASSWHCIRIRVQSISKNA
jgi:hypothetical protein